MPENNRERENEIILANEKLIWWRLYAYNLKGNPDAESFAYEAMLRAIRTFDDSYGYKLSTYATVCINNALLGYIKAENTRKKNAPYSYNNTTSEGNEFIEIIGTTDNLETDYFKTEIGDIYEYCIEEALALTPNPKHKQIIRYWLKGNCEDQLSDIAYVFGRTTASVSTIISYFRHKLKTVYKEVLQYVNRYGPHAGFASNRDTKDLEEF